MISSGERLRRLLDAGHRLTYSELTERLSVTERQARRLIKQLRLGGVPIRDERDGRTKRFFLPPENQRHAIDGLSFDHEEMRALAVAARASHAALRGTPHEPPLGRAFRKLIEHVAPKAILFDVNQQAALWHFDSAAPGNVADEAFELLEDAIEEQRSVIVDYYTASRDALTRGRRLDPLLLARRGRAWLLVAHCHLRDEIRDFALEGIRAIQLCNGSRAFFNRPDDFDAELYFRDRFSVLAGSDYYLVRLLVEPDRVPYFRRRQYLPTQQIDEVLEDGRAIVSFEVEGLDEMRAWVQSWGVGLTVVEPIELAEQVHEEAVALAERYGSIRSAGGIESSVESVVSATAVREG